MKRGNTAPEIYLTRPLAAIALAPFAAWYVSTISNMQDINTVIFPQANGTNPIMGMIQ
jgi:hypothetical protein